jgi:hypothetical protein
MTAISLELCGEPVVITTRSEPLIEIFRDYFRYYHPQLINPHSQPATPAALITLKIELEQSMPAREALIPPTAALISQAGIVELWRQPETTAQSESFYFYTPLAAFCVAPERGLIEGLIIPQALDVAHILTNTWALFALLLALRFRRVYHLHAAAAVSPDDKLYVLCGGQRSGKTTLTTALGLSGWKPVSDDSLLISGRQWQAQLTALRKSFHLSIEAQSVWKELAGMETQPRDADRSSAAALEFFGTVELAESVFKRIDYVILPQITGEDSSRLARVTASEAILRLAEQSIFFPLWPAQTSEQMNLLTQLAAHASCHRLLAGCDLLADPRRASSLLQI